MNTVSFGRFPQDADDTIRPIEWEVLKKEENKTLLLSKNILWLKREGQETHFKSFFKRAFNKNEQAAILDTIVDDSGTADKVFLLDRLEFDKYLKGNRRKKQYTAYAHKKEHDLIWSHVIRNGSVIYTDFWWLRDGAVNSVGDAHKYSVDYGGFCGVCPAMWVDLKQLSDRYYIERQ